MKFNRAIEVCPSKWDDKKLSEITGLPLPPLPQGVAGSDRYWCDTIGKEKNGIRCVLSPSMSTLIGDQFDLVAFDEVHRIKNLGAQITQCAIRLQPKYRYGLSATPITNCVSDLFPMLGWLNVPGWHRGDRRNAAWPFAREDLGVFNNTFLSFERDLTEEEIKKAADPEWRGKCINHSPVISSPARLIKLLMPSLAHISKLSCNPNLVDCRVIDVRVPMGREQAKLYQHFLDRGNIDCKHALIRARKQIAYLRGICADPHGFEYGGPPVRSNFNPKTIAILELTRDILAKGKQVVIVNARKGQTNTIQMKLQDAGIPVARIDSTVPAAQHSHQANLFKSGRARVMLMGIKCAQGYSFEKCPYLIIGSLEYSSGSKNQAEGRVFRVNSKEPITTYCVLHQHSIEEIIFDVVATKQDAATICLHGERVPREYRPVDMEEVLADSIKRFELNGQPVEFDCESKWPTLRASLKKAALVR